MSELDESCVDGEQTTTSPFVGKLNRGGLGKMRGIILGAVQTTAFIVVSVPKAMPSRVNVLWWVVPREPEAAQQRRSSVVPSVSVHTGRWEKRGTQMRGTDGPSHKRTVEARSLFPPTQRPTPAPRETHPSNRIDRRGPTRVVPVVAHSCIC
ncbi:hypothetical protein CGRA01v4_10368 [Colletotrichum graminicola]|nr:hypothetical protein CGRA01v4_10368 [Colletotrichum graminicola]